MADKRDYYEVLEVSKNVSKPELKKAYKNLARKYHPDLNHGDKDCEEKFKEANEAYSILSDDQKRSQYDRFGHNAFSGGGGFGGFNGFDDVFGDLGDIFEGFFGGRRGQTSRKNRARRGGDLQTVMQITLEEAYIGLTKTIQVPRLENCITCNGAGTKPGTSKKQCPACGGSGRIAHSQGFFSIASTCNACKGQGFIIENPCTDCGGRGRIEKNKKLSVQVPPGIHSGMKLRLSEEGEAGVNGGPSGDLYVIIDVKEHEIFSREDNNLICEVPIRVTQAILGDKIEVPTLEGKVKLSIPAGTQPEKVFRLRGKGFTILQRNGKGDLYVRVKVEIPRNLNNTQKKKIQEFSEICGKEVYPDKTGFLEKLKNFFSL